MLLLDDAKLEERRRAVAPGGPLAALYDSLESELEPLTTRALYVPDAKALLSRAGGRCERDGATLEFDPWSPHEHRCPACGTVHRGELHHRAWVMYYQLWLAERSVHAALLAVLRGEERHAALARDVLRSCAERYLRYPNQDNVLGPTRLFFSTYLESIWLLQIVIAADLLQRFGDETTSSVVRDRIVAPSSELIAVYDEGMSNRQVWNNAALIASARFLGDDRDVDRLLYGDSGLESHLSRALLNDGTWYEGENYHQFALRGLWYGVTLAETLGRGIDRALGDRFNRAFTAPYVTALPDFTMPSRKDSQYAVSLRQWRMVELAELGFARTRDPLLAGALARSYEDGHERRDTGRARSTADVERNGPASALSRADLGWRALLHALPTLPRLEPSAPASACLEGQGYAVFRRKRDVYVGFEFGQSGGGHGHPDRLNLTLYQGSTRWLDDLGTGSYVDPSLHWYRSTLAHNAPLVNGKSQPLRDAELIAFDERGDFGWIVAEFCIPDGDVRLERCVVVGPDYLIDELRWTAARDVRVELPWHLQTVPPGSGTPMPLDGGTAPEDGFAFISNATAGLGPYWLRGNRDGRRLEASILSPMRISLFSAEGPGQPASERRPFYVLRAHGREGLFRMMMSWTAECNWALTHDPARGDTLEMASGERERDVHRRDAAGWHIDAADGNARRAIDLSGFRSRTHAGPPGQAPRRAPTILRRAPISDRWLSEMSSEEQGSLVTFELGEAHYRRSEQSWSEAGQPRATVALGAGGRHLVISMQVTAGDLHFATADARNPYDNEHPDTMAAGIQLYARTARGSGAWTLVAEPRVDRVRVRAITGWEDLPPPTARWRRNAEGYEMRVEIGLPAEAETREFAIDLDVIVNETTTQRERRRGQLVMSGAPGEFVYLRGDRHDPERLIPFVLTP